MLDFIQQCQEIRTQFRERGVAIAAESNPRLATEIAELIKVCEICYKMNEVDAESTFNGFLSIMICEAEAATQCPEFCKKLEAAPNTKMQEVAFNVLYNFFEGLAEESPHRVDVYCSLVKVAGMTKSVSEIFTDVKPIKEWLKRAEVQMSQTREVYRVLHKELLSCHLSDMALKVMVELLSTYSEQDAKDAKSDAERCITASLADPNTFLLDHLLPLKPIKALENTPIHNLLKIFIFEKLSAYQEFYEKNKAFVDGLGLDHGSNVDKMRLLTFMLMAETQHEIAFEDISKELEVEDVEAFTIVALKTKLVSAKINQMSKKVVVISTMHRTFERREWEQLRDVLHSWYNRLDLVEQSTNKLIDAQYQAQMEHAT